MTLPTGYTEIATHRGFTIAAKLSVYAIFIAGERWGDIFATVEAARDEIDSELASIEYLTIRAA